MFAPEFVVISQLLLELLQPIAPLPQDLLDFNDALLQVAVHLPLDLQLFNYLVPADPLLLLLLPVSPMHLFSFVGGGLGLVPAACPAEVVRGNHFDVAIDPVDEVAALPGCLVDDLRFDVLGETVVGRVQPVLFVRGAFLFEGTPMHSNLNSNTR